MTKYTIELNSFGNKINPEQAISSAMGFDKKLSKETIVYLFNKRENKNDKNGKFSSLKRAKEVMNNINERGKFGGFGKTLVWADVVRV